MKELSTLGKPSLDPFTDLAFNPAHSSTTVRLKFDPSRERARRFHACEMLIAIRNSENVSQLLARDQLSRHRKHSG